ncbi:MAG: hypothetical protein HOU81_02030 [Hamadaea sp.]|uniref:hypothetical protein n=1 Tax=Hamadaea sp. TaxID=2024425 RepID=UPI0017AD579E|nr:hypothetical protein [Hamadaea sp.]NUR69577.1 hypothetical protein [Hamadaea sp.]NUT20311.1 hypothetical protein [Hamadaea sp.]
MDAVNLTGEEMLDWAEPSADRPGSSAVLNQAVRDVITPGERVLLAGYADEGLIRSLTSAGTHVDLLLRGLTDAESAKTAYADLAVTVHSGSLNMFPESGYDVVLALGGTARLNTPEHVLSWPDAVAALRRTVRPGGTVAVVVANPFGVDRIADPRSGVRTTDDDWPAGTAARTVTGLADALRTLELTDVRTFALFPGVEVPTAIVERAAMSETFAGVITSAWSSSPQHPAVTDLRRLVREAIRAGLGVELAPAWLFVGHTGPAGASGAAPARAYADRPVAPELAVVQAYRADGSTGWHREPLGDRSPKTSGKVMRSPEKLAGPVNAGPLLEDILLDACGQHDLTTVRTLLSRYAKWVTDAGATLDNVVVTGDELELLDPSWELSGETTAEVLTTRACLRLARRLQSGAYEHPWPAGVTVERLTISLVATAGLTVSPDDVRTAAELDAEIADAMGVPVEESTAPLGHREALATVSRLTVALEEAQAQAKGLDELVAKRDRQMADLRRSITFRIGRVVTGPLSALKKARRRR